jgi:hypothetical protein
MRLVWRISNGRPNCAKVPDDCPCGYWRTKDVGFEPLFLAEHQLSPDQEGLPLKALAKLFPPP